MSGDASQDGAAILVSGIEGVRWELESKGVSIGDWRIDERRQEIPGIFCRRTRWAVLLLSRGSLKMSFGDARMRNRVAMIWLQKMLPWLLLCYLATSLLHFAHNAEYLTKYPNLPHWLTRSDVYVSWLFITAIGAVGYLLQRIGYERAGLTLIGVYAALGFDGLLHYRQAPFMAHTVAMNFTICLEVFAAALLLVDVLVVMANIARWRAITLSDR